MKLSKILGVALISAVIGACGGGGSSSGGGSQDPESIEGLSMPEAMSVVSSSTEVAGMRISAMKRLLKMIPQQLEVSGFDGASTQYTTDQVNTFVWDESMESLDVINEIMCYIGQTGYKDMVNQDSYLALINATECRKSGSGGSQNDQSSGSNATSYETWTVSSTRASSTAPQIVQAWFPEYEDDGSLMGYMRVETIITEGISDDKPFGEFTLNFEFLTAQYDVYGSGVLKTTTPPNGSPDGAVAFIFYESESRTEHMGNGQGGDVQVVMDSVLQTKVVFEDADGNTGVAVIKKQTDVPAEGNESIDGGVLTGIRAQVDQGNKIYDVAFNGTHFYKAIFDNREDDPLVVDDESCMNRADFNTQVWRYNLYQKEGVNAGSRVSVNSGFPFKADAGGTDVFGHIGYWGIWVPYGTDLTQVTTLVRENFGPGSDADPAEYTLVQAPGKMVKSTKTEVALADIEGMALGWWPWIPPECNEQNPEIDCEGVGQITEGNEYVIEYTADTELSLAEAGKTTVAGAGFYVVGTRTWGEQGETTTPIQPAPVKISIPWFNFWSQQLGGSVSYPFEDGQGGQDLTKATIFVESFVNGADSAFASVDTVTLHCFQDCLKAEISQDEVDQANSESPFYTSIEQQWDQNGTVAPTEAAAEYSFDKATLTLRVTGGASVPEADYGKVVRLGTAASPITPGNNSQYNWGIQSQAMLTSIAGLETVWDTWNADVSYRWETGANGWNIYSAVKDANGDYVEFDAPLQMLYKHDDANNINWADGDQQTEHHDATFMLEYGGEGQLWGLPWEEDGTTGRWGNIFSLKDGTTLSDGSTNYVIKGMDREQTMVEEQSAATCTNNMQVDASLVLPTSADVDGITDDMASYANKPVVTDAPAVIEGEVQIVIE